jgi:hypothetical protein
MTTSELLRSAALEGLISSSEAEEIYAQMRAKGYRGPGNLWTDS